MTTVNRDVTLAWMTAALQRTKEMPKLTTLLARVTAPPPERADRQTPEQMRTMLHILSEQYGLRLRTGKATYHG